MDFGFSKRTKAQIVGIGKEGGPIQFVAPRKKPFIEFHWYVLERYLLILFFMGLLFGCGFFGGLIFMSGG